MNRDDQRPLSERFDLSYIKRRSWPHNRLRFFSFLLAGIGLILPAVYLGRDRQHLFSSGRLAHVHTFAEHDCQQCHLPDPARSGYWLPPTDEACLRCHNALAHFPKRSTDAGVPMRHADFPNELQMSTSCADCHIEHRGLHADLNETPDRACTRCHDALNQFVLSDLPASAWAGISPGVQPPIDNTVTDIIDSFMDNHPDWRVLDEGRVDATALRFEHYVHMDPDWPQMQKRIKASRETFAGHHQHDGGAAFREVGNDKYALTCTACHVPDAAGEYMQPISFEKHCQACHSLGSKEKVPAPHGSTIGDFIERIAYVQATKLPKIRKTSGAKKSGPRSGPRKKSSGPKKSGPKKSGPRKKSGPKRGKAGSAKAADAAPTPEQLAAALAKKIDAKRRSLTTGMNAVCGKCHGLGDDPSKIADPKIPDRWLVMSFFNHDTHRAVDCLECHVDAAHDAEEPTYTGKHAKTLKWTGRTRQVMLPSIDLCQACHHPQASIRSHCVTCHYYHDPAPWLGPGGAFPKGQRAAPLSINDFLASEEE